MLDEDHYGLKKAKERILEYLAVQALVQKLKGPILCFVGPAGRRQDLARPQSSPAPPGRKFVRLSLGGVRDEAEIRGHRRTYIGAMPGKLIQSLKKAGTNNPVFLLDEIDKMSTDFRGDPSAALLEVLDPEQNHTFNDHYLDLDYDLSKVMFICTANTHAQHPAARCRTAWRSSASPATPRWRSCDRPALPGPQAEGGERPRRRRTSTLTDEALRTIIHRYTRESGRALAGARDRRRSAARSPATCSRTASGDDPGRPQAGDEVPGRAQATATARPRARTRSGIVTGLAWTEMGGELLTTEATVMPGKGKLIITGKLGEVMQESAQAAMSLRALARRALRHRREVLRDSDIHIHLPEGAIPKDGPSAGVTMATALVSALTRIPVRRDVAMTGEITLRGRVLPIGGPQGEDAGGAPRGHQDGPHPQGEPEGPPGHPEEDPRRSCASSRWSTWTRCFARRWCWRSRRSSSASPRPSRSRCRPLRRRRPENQRLEPHLGRPLAGAMAEADTLDLGFFAPPNAPAVRHARR